LDLWSGPAPGGRPDLLPTKALVRHASCARLLDRVRHVRAFFPELDGASLKVGLTRAAAGFASREERYIWINPHRLTLHTIAHELTHLLQNEGHVPGGEKAADLFALARHSILVDDLPCYLRSPRSLKHAWLTRRADVCRLLHRTARDAVAARASGVRTYLVWFETELEARWERERFVDAAPEAASQETLFGARVSSDA